MGILCSAWLSGLGVTYAMTLLFGFATIASPQEIIPDPMFTVLETLILLMAPAMIGLMAAIHAWARPDAKVLAVAALSFMTVTVALTTSVHFAILILSRHPSFQNPSWRQALSFEWPSLVYLLDILAWDLFFGLAMILAAPVFTGRPLATAIRVLMFASGIFALAGLAGVAVDDMRVRNIGVIGYGVLFPLVAALLAVLFARSRPS